MPTTLNTVITQEYYTTIPQHHAFTWAPNLAPEVNIVLVRCYAYSDGVSGHICVMMVTIRTSG